MAMARGVGTGASGGGVGGGLKDWCVGGKEEKEGCIFFLSTGLRLSTGGGGRRWCVETTEVLRERRLAEEEGGVGKRKKVGSDTAFRWCLSSSSSSLRGEQSGAGVCRTTLNQARHC